MSRLVFHRLVSWDPFTLFFFFNDITEHLQSSDCFLYCDELKFFSSKVATLIQTEIGWLALWACKNGLQFHPDKCKRLNFNWHEPLTINGGLINPVKEMVDLGGVTSSILKWSSNVGAKLGKRYEVFNFLCQNLH